MQTFHGQLFVQFQDHRALFARSTNGADPQFQRNQFGGSISGPFLKNKLSFFRKCGTYQAGLFSSFDD